jgi:hypothetical protein
MVAAIAIVFLYCFSVSNLSLLRRKHFNIGTNISLAFFSFEWYRAVYLGYSRVSV